MTRLPDTLDVQSDFPEVGLDKWRALVDRDLRGAPFEKKLVTHTYEGIRLQPLYTQDDAIDAPAHAGQSPWTRGVQTPEPGRGWDLRQELTEPTLELANRALLDDLAHGVTSVTVRLDLAGRSGFDGDRADAHRLVGTDGIALSTLGELRALFEGVHLNMIGVGLEAGAAFLPAASMLAGLWREREVDPAECRGAFNADPLAVLARDGKLPTSLDNAYAQMGDLACWTNDNWPRVKSVRVGTAPYHHAGATASQDLAFSTATAIEYLRVLTGAGLGVEDAGRQLLFNYAVGTSFFLGSSKLRAARRLWHRVLEASGADPAAVGMTIHAKPSKRVLTTRDPWVNLLRNTACLFAGAVGGADIVTSAPFDQSLGLPSPRGRRIARNTATVLHEEAHLLRVGDPAGGSWYLEHLADDLAQKAWIIVQEIERRGGMSESLRSGWVAQQLASSLDARTRNLATRRDAVIGVSEFPIMDDGSKPAERLSHAAVVGDARRRLVEHRRAFADAPKLGTVNPGDRSATESLAQAATKGATLGELSSAVFAGEGETIDAPLLPHPYAESFERLRDASDAFEREAGFRPRVFLVQIGTPAHFNARSGFATGFFNAGGFEVVESGPVSSADAAADAFALSGANIAVICSTDKQYESDVSVYAPALRSAGAASVVLAGNPGEHESAYRSAGVDRFIFIKCDVVATLTELLAETGVFA